MANDLAQIYELIKAGGGEIASLEPAQVSKPFWQRWGDDIRTHIAYHTMGERLIKGLERQTEAAKQGVVVNAAFDAMGLYGTNYGLTEEPTGITFGRLRQMAHHCEPAAGIISTWIRYMVTFMDIPDKHRGVVKRPGLEIQMRNRREAATDEDKREMHRLTDFLLEGGFTEPPDAEMPMGYRPGLQTFCAQIIRDSLTMDGAVVRRWASEDGRYPVAVFCAEDAGRIRRASRKVVDVVNGVRQYAPYEGEVSNRTGEPIRFLRVDTEGAGGRARETFTARQMAYCIRNPRTDEAANGYGYSELEHAVNLVTIWCNSLSYNGGRFDKDSLPRGIILLLGQLSETQSQNFKMRWKQMLGGRADNRWRTPIYTGRAEPGAGVQYVPLDQSSRDMEYHQFMFLVSIILHVLYGIHPEETGMQSVSPFRPPLSEASPEAKLQNSSDKGFEPLARWYQNDILNREILWKVRPDRRYAVRLIGLGQGDEGADIELRGKILTFGLSTPRRQLAELDEPVPEHLENDPAMDMLGTWAANHELLMQMQQAKLGEQQAKQAMAQAQDSQQQQAAVQKMQALGQPGAAGPGQPVMGAPPGQQVAPAGLPPGSQQEPDAGGQALQKAILGAYSDPYETFPPRRRVRERRQRVLKSILDTDDDLILVGDLPAKRKR